MDLTSTHPFWPLKDGLIASYPSLGEDLSCDVVVVGAGITGAILAERLTKIGMSVIVVDRRDVGSGSTAANTGLLQYEIDVPMVCMAKKIGRENAERAYTICHRSIDDLESLVARVGADCEFERKTSIYLASDQRGAGLLADEARVRKSIGLDVTYHDRASLRDAFGIDGAAALSSQQAASCDPYRLSHELLAHSVKLGAMVFDRTEVVRLECHDDEVRLTTNREARIMARNAVIATGYETLSLLDEKVADLNNTYALVSRPLGNPAPWDAQWMLWEAKDPYLYFRMTGDNRLLAGGEDDAFHSPSRRDANIALKAQAIEQKVRRLIPGLDWEVEYAWGGTFGNTADGLPYIGATPQYPSCLFALGFGGNGIIFGIIAAELIGDRLRGIPNSASSLFRFGR